MALSFNIHFYSASTRPIDWLKKILYFNIDDNSLERKIHLVTFVFWTHKLINWSMNLVFGYWNPLKISQIRNWTPENAIIQNTIYRQYNYNVFERCLGHVMKELVLKGLENCIRHNFISVAFFPIFDKPNLNTRFRSIPKTIQKDKPSDWQKVGWWFYLGSVLGSTSVDNE